MHRGLAHCQMLLAQNDPAAALEFVERVLPVNAVDPRVVDELMVLGARAAADLVQRASDDRDQARRTGPSGGTDQAGQDASDPARDRLPALRSRRHRPARPGRPLRRRVRASRRSPRTRSSLWREAVAACAEAGLGWEQQIVVMAARRGADRVGRLRHRGGRAAARASTTTPPSRAPPRCRPASRSSPRVPASHWPRQACPLPRPCPPPSPG